MNTTAIIVITRRKYGRTTLNQRSAQSASLTPFRRKRTSMYSARYLMSKIGYYPTSWIVSRLGSICYYELLEISPMIGASIIVT